MGIWLIVILVALRFITKDALPFFSFDEESLGRFFENKYVLITHISCGIVAMVLGPFQFWPSFRINYTKWHRFST